MSEAADQQMRVAVERWAQSRGMWREGGGYVLLEGSDRHPWWLWRIGDSIRVRSCSSRRDVDRREIWGPDGRVNVEVSPHAALVWALVLEARPLRDGSRCKRCRGRGEWSWWHDADRPGAVWPVWAGLTFTRASNCTTTPGGPWPAGVSLLTGHGIGPDWSHWTLTGLCPDCEGTGLADLTDAYAQQVLDARPKDTEEIRIATTGPCPDCDSSSAGCRRCRGRREWSWWSSGPTMYFAWPPGVQVDPHDTDERGTCRLNDPLGGWLFGTRLRWTSSKVAFARSGDPTSIEALHVLADRLQDQGDPLGLDISHLLAGERDGTEAAVERLLDRCPSQVVTCTVLSWDGRGTFGTASIAVDTFEPVGTNLNWFATPAAIADVLASRWNEQDRNFAVASARVQDAQVILTFRDRLEHTVTGDGMAIVTCWV